MENILLTHNESIFNNYGFVSLPIRNEEENIPNYSCVLFIGSHDKGCDHIEQDFQYTLTNIGKKREQTFVILLGKTDDTLPVSLSIPINVVRIYANNIIYNHPKVRFFPMGRDRRSILEFSIKPDGKKDILCYCNFSTNTHPSRQKIYESLKNKTFIEFEHMGNFLAYEDTHHLSRENFFQKLCRSKFTICPRGNAIDTFRFYDSLYCDCIPIVVKTHFHKHFEHLPILFIDNDAQFQDLTKEYLEQKYEILIKRKKKYFHELDMKYWLDMVKYDLLIPGYY
jgi:hypothetical protein